MFAEHFILESLFLVLRGEARKEEHPLRYCVLVRSMLRSSKRRPTSIMAWKTVICGTHSRLPT
jgi:N6-adenosine-specific RNA methylase IME4